MPKMPEMPSNEPANEDLAFDYCVRTRLFFEIPPSEPIVKNDSPNPNLSSWRTLWDRLLEDAGKDGTS